MLYLDQRSIRSETALGRRDTALVTKGAALHLFLLTVRSTSFSFWMKSLNVPYTMLSLLSPLSLLYPVPLVEDGQDGGLWHIGSATPALSCCRLLQLRYRWILTFGYFVSWVKKQMVLKVISDHIDGSCVFIHQPTSTCAISPSTNSDCSVLMVNGAPSVHSVVSLDCAPSSQGVWGSILLKMSIRLSSPQR